MGMKAPAERTAASPTLGIPPRPPGAAAEANMSGVPLPSTRSVMVAMDGERRRCAARRDMAAGVKHADAEAARKQK